MVLLISGRAGPLRRATPTGPSDRTDRRNLRWANACRSPRTARRTFALIAILLAHRTMPTAALRAAMDRAVTSGCLDPETVLIDARRDTSALVPVVAIGALARYDRPPPSLTDYDDLLTGRPS
jgi:hypothetical protein